MLKTFFMQAARISGANALARARGRDQFRIVTYHGVEEGADPLVNFDRLQMSPRVFAAQLERLARVYRVVSLEEAVRGFLAGRGWPDRGLAITFDDGYRNNLDVAAPILRRMGLPATFFVTSGFVEGTARSWWYDLRALVAVVHETELLLPGEPARNLRTPADRMAACYALERAWSALTSAQRDARMRALREAAGADAWPSLRYPFLARAQLRSLADQGFGVGPHGSTHASLGAEAPEVAVREVADSTDWVASVCGRACPVLAWPYGHDPHARELVQPALAEAGLLAAVGTQTGGNGSAADLFSLRRYDLHGGYSPAAAEARVAGTFAALRGGVA